MWHLDRTGRTRGCEFIINTSDNLCGLLLSPVDNDACIVMLASMPECV